MKRLGAALQNLKKSNEDGDEATFKIGKWSGEMQKGVQRRTLREEEMQSRCEQRRSQLAPRCWESARNSAGKGAASKAHKLRNSWAMVGQCATSHCASQTSRRRDGIVVARTRGSRGLMERNMDDGSMEFTFVACSGGLLQGRGHVKNVPENVTSLRAGQRGTPRWPGRAQQN